MQVIELLYFAVLCVVFLFAYGVAAQSLLYPQSKDNWWDILFNIFYNPYLSMFQEFPLDELQGKRLHRLSCFGATSFVLSSSCGNCLSRFSTVTLP